MDKPQTLNKTVKIKLLKVHTHAGEQKKAGDVLEVSEPTAKWLLDNKVGERVV